MSLLKPLTVAEIRRSFWDKDKKKDRKIKYYSFQSFDGKLDGEQPRLGSEYIRRNPETFIPDGRLIHKNVETNKREVIDDYLSISRSGPYKKKDFNKSVPDFYYLSGHNENGEEVCFQVCSGPPNVVGKDACDEVLLWIKK